MNALLDGSALERDAPQPWQDAAKGYWVLFVYCLFSMLQTMMWAIPGTVSTTLTSVFPNSVSPFAVQVILSWGSLFFVLCSFPVAYILARPYGIRRCTVLGIFFLTACAVCRCAAQNDSPLTLALWNISGIFAGLANPLAMGAPALIAETWFQPKHRGLAMALAAEANSIGGAVAFLIPPALLPADTLRNLNHVNVVCLGACLACCLCCLYLPDKPSVPPSRSAIAETTASDILTFSSMIEAVMRLARSPQTCLVVLMYAVVSIVKRRRSIHAQCPTPRSTRAQAGGFNSAWAGTLNLNLSQVGLSQNMAGYIGFASTLGGNIVGILCGLFVDRFHRMKPSLVALNIINVVALVGFAIFVRVRREWPVCALF